MAGSLYLAICILYVGPPSLDQYDKKKEIKPRSADGKQYESVLSVIIIVGVQSGCVYCKLGAIVAAGVSIVLG